MQFVVLPAAHVLPPVRCLHDAEAIHLALEVPDRVHAVTCFGIAIGHVPNTARPVVKSSHAFAPPYE